MSFEKLLPASIIDRSASSKMLYAAATEIETKVGGNWVHDANDSDKPTTKYNVIA